MTNYKERKKNLATSTMGKIPPQATDLENYILGTVMLERGKIYEVIDTLTPEMFYHESNKNVFRAIAHLYSQNKPFDPISVTQQLRDLGVLEITGGAYYITTLTNGVTGTENIEFWGRIVMEKFLARELIRASSEAIQEAYEDTADPFDVLGNLSTFVANAEVGFIGSNESVVGDVVQGLVKQRANSPKKKNHINGLETGIYELDKLIDGFGGGELIAIGARPAMGKTAVICSVAAHLNIKTKVPIAVFSLEMSKVQITLRLEANISGIDGKKIKNEDLSESEWQALHLADNLISDGTLIIDDYSALNINMLISRIRMYVRKYGIKAVLLDYLQLLNGVSNKPGNREAEISAMTRALKVCAQELNIPIVILCQLSRQVESRRPFCIPSLADLRESGAIEQDCDKVIFLWRPSYYLTDEQQADPKIGSTTAFRLYGKQIANKNLLVFIVAKHREGELGNVPALFTPWNMRVMDHPDLSGVQSTIPLPETIPISNVVKLNPNEKYSDNPDDTEADVPF